jgi:type II secretory pathway pseudopilin PulG
MTRVRKKQALTLLEIMIVIFLIGLIGSVIGYNMKGSLEEGKAFKTEKAIEQIHDILMLEVAKGSSIDEVAADPEGYLSLSNLVNHPDKLIVDGWGTKFDVKPDQHKHDLVVSSDAYDKYLARRKGKVGKKSNS